MNLLNRLLHSVILLCVLLVPACASAEIACDCTGAKCSCFVQKGDEGIAVERAVDLLAEQGYLSSSRIGTFDDRVYDAVCEFQKDHALSQSGMLDDDTLTMLIWGNRMSEEKNAEVWVPTDGGKKRHRTPTCSGMYDPRKMSALNAQALGLDACKRCNPE